MKKNILRISIISIMFIIMLGCIFNICFADIIMPNEYTKNEQKANTNTATNVVDNSNDNQDVIRYIVGGIGICTIAIATVSIIMTKKNRK